MTAALGRRRWFAALARLPHARNLGRIAALLSGSVGASLLTFLTQLVLTRTLPVADYGRLVALLATVNILQLFAGYGIGWFWLQLFGREGRTAFRWVGATIRLVVLASTAATAALAAYVFLVGGGGSTANALVFVLLVAILLGQSLIDTTSARLQLEERYLALAAWQAATQAGRFLAVLGVAWCSTPDLLHVLAGYAAVGLVTLALSLRSLDQMRQGAVVLAGHAEDESRSSPDGPVTLAATLAEATPYCASLVFYLVFLQGVVVILERMSGPSDAAMYQVAFLMVSAAYLIPSVLYMKFLAAKIFRWWAHDREKFALVIPLGAAGGGAAGLVAMLAVMTVAPIAVPLLFGPRYAAAVPILIVLSIAIPVRFVQHAFGAAFFSRENMRRKAWYLGAAALCCVAWSLILIPRFGAFGAAAASVLAETSLLGFYLWGIARHIEAVDVRTVLSAATMRRAWAFLERTRGSEVHGQ
jgi:O-antigen/teichoic acid export membrane protein